MYNEPFSIDHKSYNQGTRGLAGVSLARYWTSLIFTVIVFIIGLVVDSLSKEIIYSYGLYGYGYAYNPNRDTIEVLGIITGILSIIFLLTYLVLFIIYFVKLYDFRKLIPEADVRRGANSLITSMWLMVGSVIFIILVAILAAAEETLAVLIILPLLGLLVGLIFEIIGFGQLQSAKTLHQTTRGGFTILFVSDLIYCFNMLLAIILSAVTASSAIHGEDTLTAYSTTRIVCGSISLVIMIIAMVGWSKVGTPIRKGEMEGEPKPQPVAEPAPAPAPKPETKPEPKPQPVAEPAPVPTPAPEPAPAPKPAPAPEPAPAPKPRPKFCTNCGSPLPEGAKFCTNCGSPVK